MSPPRPRPWHTPMQAVLLSLALHALALYLVNSWSRPAAAPNPHAPIPVLLLSWVPWSASAARLVIQPAMQPAVQSAGRSLSGMTRSHPRAAVPTSPAPALVPSGLVTAPESAPAVSPVLPAAVGHPAGQGEPTPPVSPAVPRPVAPPVQSARPDYAYNPPPDYPLLLREQGVGGVVWLRVWVDSEGRPGEVKLAQGSGYRLLDDAALRAVRHWRFIPAKNGDHAQASWVEFPVRFTLNS